MSGPPGSGKTLLARSIPNMLPRMAREEALDVTKIYSVSGLLPSSTPLIDERPFRAPHYTISNTGLVGGGRLPRPEEVTLSHGGVHLLHASGGIDQYRRLTNELPSQSGDALPDCVFHRSRKQRQLRRDLTSSRFHDYPLERNQGVLFPRTALFYINYRSCRL